VRSIAILSALAEEQSGLLGMLTAPRQVAHAGRLFWTGTVHGREVTLALSRIGKVAAATTATALIERFGAQQIVFTGVAGGLGEGVKPGDLVVASQFLQHDMDASPLFPRHEVPLYSTSRFLTDGALSAQLLEATRSLSNDKVCVHHGLIVSGDRFVATRGESLALQSSLPDALAVEMEGAAVAQVCHDYGLPFAAVRSISDRADDDAHIDFPRFVREVASRYADVVIRQLLLSLPA
jgi:adenosylhomocysteine nucleosidase